MLLDRFLPFAYHHPARRSSKAISLPEMNLSRRRRSEDKDPFRVYIDKKALLVLRLSSSSFLDSKIFDPLSPDAPLYTVHTANTSTTIVRMVPGTKTSLSETTEGVTIVADIRWPQHSGASSKRQCQPGTLVQMDGLRWKAGENFLTPQTLLSIPQFRIPGFSHSLKWKRTGNSYHCITSSVKGPIAILDLATPTSVCRLSVYETLRDKYDTNSLSSYNGVSLLLLDYLVTSALLLVTDPEEWIMVPKPNDSTLIANRLRELKNKPKSERSLAYGPNSTAVAGDQWRKIVRGEHGYPTITPKPSALTLNGKTPTASSEQMRKILFGEALFPKRRPQSVSGVTSSDSDIDDEDLMADDGTMSEYTIGLSSGPPWLSLPKETMSPSTESASSPRPNTPSAPNHAYLDPSFYNSPIPPLPLIPSLYRVRSESVLHRAHASGHDSQDSLLESISRLRVPAEQHIDPSFARRIVHSTSDSTISRDVDFNPPAISTSASLTSTHGRRLPQPPGGGRELARPAPALSQTTQKRSSTYSARSIRSLPPTPVDSQSATSASSRVLSPLREKASTASLRPRRESTYPGARDTIFEVPPPAYHAIDFAGPVSGSSTTFRALPRPPLQH